ncbi:hypothetical protein V8F20_003601 [Naviculisporaceae sp. PSN 640]
MPPVNQAVLASAGIIAVSVAVAAAIAIYESPEIRRAAEDLRRRIAIALHSMGENIDPEQREPRFNRPEDAEGFLQSRGSLGAEQGVDADDETRRRQREELMYWNAQREARMERENRGSPRIPRRTSSRGSNFDDFLEQDKTAERGTMVFNTGANHHANSADQQLSRRRGFVGGVRGLSASMIANPFSDEYGIELDEHPQDIQAEEESRRLMSPAHDEAVPDIYNATPRDDQSVVSDAFPQSKPVVPEVLFDFDSHTRSESATMEQESQAPSTTSRSATLERELSEDEYMTAGQEDRADAYASIQAWAQGSSNGFYSPLPVTPAAPLSEVSEAEMITAGDLTPTDSVSLAGSGEDIGNDAASSKNGDYDVMSQVSSDDGMATPSSWSEVGSQISESESAVHA